MPGRRRKNYKTFRDVAKDGASHFSLVHRSQRDPMLADSEASEFVLAPDETKEKRLEEQQKYGIYFEDDYDYMVHLMETSEVRNSEMEQWSSFQMKEGEDDVLSVSAASTATSRLQLPSSALGSVVERDVGILNMAAPSSGPPLDLDPDIAATLDDDYIFGSDEEIEDNFVEMANAEPEEGVQPEHVDEDKIAYDFKMMRFQQQQQAFDFHGYEEPEEDKESEGLLKETEKRKESNEDEEIEDDDEGTEIASDGADYDDDDDDDDYIDDSDDGDEYSRDNKTNVTNLSRCSSSVLPRNRNLQLIDEMHDALMEREYGVDQIGALDGEDLRGRCNFDGELFKQIAADMDNYKKVFTMKDIVDSEERIRPVVPEKWRYIEEKDYSVEEEEKDFSQESLPGKVVPKYDVESIQSTLSRTKNIPKMIVWPEDPKKKKKKENMLADAETASTSTLPGLTLRELEQQQRMEKLADAPTTYRPKGETAEEKRERKKAIRDYQKERRAEKKENKKAFATQMDQLKKVSTTAAAQKKIVPLNT